MDGPESFPIILNKGSFYILPHEQPPKETTSVEAVSEKWAGNTDYGLNKRMMEWKVLINYISLETIVEGPSLH